jgi:hypothetical protein
MPVFFQLTLNVTVPASTASPDTVTPFCANNTKPPPSPLPRRGSNNKARRIILTPNFEEEWFFLKRFVFIFFNF